MNLRSVTPLLLTVSLALLSACSGSNRYCLKEQDYQKAQTLPPLTPVPGLQLPDSTAALRIPPQPEVIVPFGVADKEGNGQCLDQPPRLKVQAPATA